LFREYSKNTEEAGWEEADLTFSMLIISKAERKHQYTQLRKKRQRTSTLKSSLSGAIICPSSSIPTDFQDPLAHSSLPEHSEVRLDQKFLKLLAT